MRINDNKVKECKKAALSWLAIYILITSLIYILNGRIVNLPIYLQTLILTLITTPIMHIVMPWLHKIIKKK